MRFPASGVRGHLGAEERVVVDEAAIVLQGDRCENEHERDDGGGPSGDPCDLLPDEEGDECER